jgi:hypothetical protein
MISVVNMDISREDFAVVVKESACERVLDIPALPIKIFELLDLGDAHRFAKCCKTAKVPDEYYRLLLIKKVNARFVRREGVELDCADIKLVLVNANESLKRESASAKMSKSPRSPRTATAVNSSSPQAQAQTHDGLFLTLYKYFTYVRQLYDGGIVPSGAHLTFVDCSSVDRSEENPRNMLTESNCLKVIDNLTMNGLTPGLLHQQRIHAQWRSVGGAYVPAAPGGDLLRDGPAVLPTGSNIHALDPYRIPSDTALLRGRIAAEKIIGAHRKANGGAYPETVAVTLWGLDVIKTKGESVAIVLGLVGAVPRRESTGRIVAFDLVPMNELQRPRIDVVCSLSGIFRDTFSHVLNLLDEMFEAAAAEDPALLAQVLADAAGGGAVPDTSVVGNFIRKHSDQIIYDLSRLWTK